MGVSLGERELGQSGKETIRRIRLALYLMTKPRASIAAAAAPTTISASRVSVPM